ncbi:hypothetical protein LXL04_023859 [Taraxacum kok-saghyz]
MKKNQQIETGKEEESTCYKDVVTGRDSTCNGLRVKDIIKRYLNRHATKMLTTITISCPNCKDPSGSNEKNSQASYLEEKTEPPTTAMGSSYPVVDNPPPATYEFFLNRFVTTHETAAKQPDSHHLSAFLPFKFTQEQQPPPPESADIFFNSRSKSSSELIPEFTTSISNPILPPPPRNTVNLPE